MNDHIQTSSGPKRPAIVRRTHILKCQNPFFTEVKKGNKTFELRFDDRDFKELDLLILCEVDSELRETGRECVRTISYVLRDSRFVRDGIVALALQPASFC